MIKLIRVIGIFGFLICLLVMYMTGHGIRSIQTFDSSFRLLDMRFHYSSETVKQTFEQIQKGGRIAYQKYLVLDFIFILCFLITMVTLSDAVHMSPEIKTFLYILCVLRALFDVFENILLLHMLKQYPVFSKITATICSWFTTLKFVMLYIWLLTIITHTIICGIKSIRKYL
ncbi:hypothetical protein [Anaerocolumna sp. MB42-C2]|uniref:hypothetical protein n=1 Tax=Anaerocolumna sp. MB42-C2 TaxID=3070997 RepID=UPI0027E14677|nr:hypothetical protein [Anaerocolumna sp. MB42-C2]WMJ89344.1 hypothetical protein RBU59_07410 [Anaerocolumna sp. MB42-C2]